MAMRSENKIRKLIDTKSIHYNPTGPGDYNLPSSFGELPPPRQRDGKAKVSNQAVKKIPAFTIGLPIDDKRVFENNLNSLHSLGSPPLGIYDPIDPRNSSFEDKARLRNLKATKFNPYASQNSRQ